MYHWRNLTDAERLEVLQHRRTQLLPWHSPPHYSSETGLYLMTAACYEHKHVIGYSPERMTSFEQALLQTSHELCTSVYAWAVLPSHYHMLVQTSAVAVKFGAIVRKPGSRVNVTSGRR